MRTATAVIIAATALSGCAQNAASVKPAVVRSASRAEGNVIPLRNPALFAQLISEAGLGLPERHNEGTDQ